MSKHGVTDGQHSADAEGTYELTKANVEEAIEAKNPNYDQISKALDIKVKLMQIILDALLEYTSHPLRINVLFVQDDLAKSGVSVPPGEEIWRGEVRPF